MQDERDKARSERVWDTINRGGIIHCIANVASEARDETFREVAAMLGCKEELQEGASFRDLRAQIVDQVDARERAAVIASIRITGRIVA